MRNEQSYEDGEHSDRVLVNRPFPTIVETKIVARHRRLPSEMRRMNSTALGISGRLFRSFLLLRFRDDLEVSEIPQFS
jgi:hypothetical protein